MRQRKKSPRHSTNCQGNTATWVDVEAVANRLPRCVRFGQPLENKLSTSRTRGTRLNRLNNLIFNKCNLDWQRQ